MQPVRLFCLALCLLIAGCAFEYQEAVSIDESAEMQAKDGITDLMRETAAREVAIQVKNRTAPMLPLLYWSRYTYAPEMDGICRVTVTEKNLSMKITNTFRFDLCEGEDQPI